MQVELLYFGGCPHWQVADDRLSQALAELGGADVVVSRRLVETPEQAEELAFLESPTIRIDGTHPFATGDEIVELTCRVYATPSGLSGSPHTAQLLEVPS